MSKRTTRIHSASGCDVESARLIQARGQRDKAAACAILSLASSIVLVLSNFPGDHQSIDAAREAISAHEKLIVETNNVLKQNQAALKDNKEALARLEGRSH